MATVKKGKKDEGKRLKEPVQLFIVQRLACMNSPSAVAEMVREELGVEITRMHVSKYQVGHPSAANLAAKWVDIFTETRREFLKNVTAIPIANKAYRLQSLQQEHDKAKRLGNGAMVAQLCEQAAKEEGGAFTNRRELSGPNGKPMQARIGTVRRVIVDPAGS